MAELEAAVANYRTDTSIRRVLSALISTLNAHFRRYGCCVKGSLKDNTFSTLRQMPDIDVTSIGEFTAEEQRCVEVVYSGRPSVYHCRLRDRQSAMMLELAIMQSCPVNIKLAAAGSVWKEDSWGGEIYLSPRGVRHLSYEWGRWALLPMEASVTGAASSVVLDKDTIAQLLAPIYGVNPSLGRALERQVLPNLGDIQLEIDITAKFQLDYGKVPGRARAWETRSRTGWPTRELVDRVRRAGVRFAPKVDKEKGRLDRDFRMDFAQDLLMEDYPHHQKVVVLLKDLAEVHVKPHVAGFKSFFFKSALVWELEEAGLPAPGPGAMVGRVLGRLTNALMAGHLPDYFEPELNLLAPLDSDGKAVAASRLQMLTTDLPGYIAAMSGAEMAASVQLVKLAEMTYRVTLTDDDDGGGGGSSWLPGQQGVRPQAFLQGLLSRGSLGELGASLFLEFAGPKTSRDARPSRRRRVKNILLDVLGRAAAAAVGPAALPFKKPAPEWLTDVLPYLKDHDAERGGGEPDLPTDAIINHVIYRVVQWIGFTMVVREADVTKTNDTKATGQSDLFPHQQKLRNQ